MALFRGYGILFATMITLLLVPSLYVVIEDVVGLFRRVPEKATSEPVRAGEVS